MKTDTETDTERKIESLETVIKIQIEQLRANVKYLRKLKNQKD